MFHLLHLVALVMQLLLRLFSVPSWILWAGHPELCKMQPRNVHPILRPWHLSFMRSRSVFFKRIFAMRCLPFGNLQKPERWRSHRVPCWDVFRQHRSDSIGGLCALPLEKLYCQNLSLQLPTLRNKCQHQRFILALSEFDGRDFYPRHFNQRPAI